METTLYQLNVLTGSFLFFFLISGFPPVKGCEYWEWKCHSGECITLKSRCNKDYECRDKSDEENCNMDDLSVTDSPGCPDGMFQCYNQKCYYIEWHCDGTRDCTDGTDERSCPGKGLMPTSSLIGMSVTVGGLFLLLIGILIMIICVRRKNGIPPFRRRQGISGGTYPGNRLSNGPIACPTISGEIVMREPPPRYTSQPDLYISRPAAAVNLAFCSDEEPFPPPPCYTSQPNLVNDMSNLSVCSSVEPPPSYTSQDENVLDTTVTEGAINLSFCPDDADYSFSHQRSTFARNNSMNSSYLSIPSMKSWADNLDTSVLSLASQIDRTETHPSSTQARTRHASNAIMSNNVECNYLDTSQSASLSKLDKSLHSVQPRVGYHCAARISSKVQRAKRLGKQYSSTPMLVDGNYPSYGHRRVSLDTSDIDATPYDLSLYGNGSQMMRHTSDERRVKSAVQLDQSFVKESTSNIENKPTKAESTSCCNSYQSRAKENTGSQGLQFWRNNRVSLSTVTATTCKSEASIPESDEGFEDDTEKFPSTQNVKPSSLMTAAISNQGMMGSLSQIYLTDCRSAGSDSSINSWLC